MADKTVYIASGQAKDQETIVRLRSYMEDEISKIIGKYNKSFKYTKLFWNMGDDGLFNFKLKCYA